MNKHSMSIAFALIGLSVAGLISGFNVIAILLGLCIGGFTGYFVAGLSTAKSTLLQQGFAELGNLREKPLDEIIEKVGMQTSFSPCTITDWNNEQGFFYTWTENSYSITLLLDSNKNCIGVHRETKI
ncbi:MAG: hypothetical protein LBU91_08160 [Bacteroidales bacterium]|jgi:hypothetical protein|nr:hypothetical protein [Bacteroidales bacterium]